MAATTESVTEDIDLSGQTALVTGASSGLGMECARVLALRGATVLLACRNGDKAQRVVDGFVESIGAAAAARCRVEVCDLADKASVAGMVARLVEAGVQLDIVHLNAGVFGLPFELTDDGFERTFAANYIGHFLIVHGLLTGGSLAPGCRIIATQSEGGYKNPMAKVDLEMLAHADSAPRFLAGYKASPNSKVLLLLMMLELRRRFGGMAPAPFTFNAADPGATLTDNVNQLGPVVGALSRPFSSMLFKPVEAGAAILLWLATSDEVADQNGELFVRGFRTHPIPKKFRDAEVATKAWQTTETLLGLQPLAEAP